MVKIEIEVDVEIAKDLELLAEQGEKANRKMLTQTRLIEAVVESAELKEDQKDKVGKAVAEMQEVYASSVRLALFLRGIASKYKATDEGKAAFEEVKPEAPSEQLADVSV